jgi:hypothetical protein
LQPRAKSRVFAANDIRYHPVPVAFHFFLPQSCHNEFSTLSDANTAEVTWTIASSYNDD